MIQTYCPLVREQTKGHIIHTPSFLLLNADYLRTTECSISTLLCILHFSHLLQKYVLEIKNYTNDSISGIITPTPLAKGVHFQTQGPGK